ncbi:MAG: SDR family NAD(P)-dependent oxidoreductase [Pseudomonadota bacterium]
MARTVQGSKIIVTGATDGIGKAAAIALKERGAYVLAVGRRSPKRSGLPRTLAYCEADLSEAGFLETIMAKLESLGWNQLDHLVHNAATGYVGHFKEEPADHMTTQITVNLTAPMVLTNGLAGHLERASGSVLFVGSTASWRGTPHYALYTATKSGLTDFARNLRTEWKGRIHVQEVIPGPTRTSFHRKSGLLNPPLASLYMTADEVAQGIVKSLETGRVKKRYPASALIFHAIKRSVLGQQNSGESA